MRGEKSMTKPKSFGSALKKLALYSKKDLIAFIIAIIGVCISVVCTLISPSKIKDGTNIISEGVTYNYAVSNEDFSKLKEDGTINLSVENFSFDLVYNEIENTISVNVSSYPVITADYQDLLDGKELAENNIGLTISNGVLNVWFNTDAKVNIDKIMDIIKLLITLFVISFIFNTVEIYVISGVTQNICRRLRQDISKKIDKLPLKYLDSVPVGDVLSRITNDVDQVGNALYNSSSVMISAILTFLGSIFMMFYTNGVMAISAILASLLGFSILAIILKASQKYFVLQQKELAELNSKIEEDYTGHNVIKAYNAEKEKSISFEETNKKLFKSGWKSQFLSSIMGPLMGFIGNLGYVVVCIVGAILVVKGKITFGVIIAFTMYVRYFTNPLSEIAQGLTNLQSGLAASERVFEFLDEKEMPEETNVKYLNPSEVKGNIEFKDVKFGYNQDKIIINDFSLKVNAGEKVAIVGPTGAGKTTMVNLLMRFYDVNSGSITIDGYPISELSRANVHDLFGMVLQDTWLFEGTIKENLMFNKENVSFEEIKNACVMCGLDHFIMTLPKGYDTVLDDNTSISAGQKQLLTIARAMIQNSPMLILDEATSSVDTRTEILIQEAMDKLTQNRTSFVIAHRLSTIKNADKIIVMKNGDIVESGTHEELLIKNGAYAELYNSQFEEVEE